MGTLIGIAVIFFLYFYIVIKFPNGSMDAFKARIAQMAKDLQKREEEVALLKGNYKEAVSLSEQLHDDVLQAQAVQQQLLQKKEEWKQKHQTISNQKLHENQALYFTRQVPEEDFHKEDFDIFNGNSHVQQDEFLHNEQLEPLQQNEWKLEEQRILAAELENDALQTIGTDMIRDETDHGMVNGMGFHLHDPQNQPDPIEHLDDAASGHNNEFPDNPFPDEPIDSMPDDGFIDIPIMDVPSDDGWDMPDSLDPIDDRMDTLDDGMDIYDNMPDDPYQ
ncbi:hypothetical protein [Sediminibacillus halophilus]|uniref:Uncharacterized protein n=1 Tax=Sediminibacillus halophilus TaxID=482461 RepID=A0A1G9WB62_9BACI|nr:hypothetical protein [Sediminibacillus halophilus]SDM81523.1 hypothetical protein SAMN05216244_3493 [Sediminibacillus halophilus]